MVHFCCSPSRKRSAARDRDTRAAKFVGIAAGTRGEGGKRQIVKGQGVCRLTYSPRSLVSPHWKLLFFQNHSDLSCFALDHEWIGLKQMYLFLKRQIFVNKILDLNR